MEFLDPKKQRAYNIKLFVGYFLVAICLVLAGIILLYQANGFGITREGNVVQNGLIFVSAQPRPADIYIDNQLYKDQTNTRILLQAGQYKFRVQRDGYRPWQRSITIEGGSVSHFDYPLLFPTDLKTNKVADFASVPKLTIQSPDRRWLVVQNGVDFATMTIFDLADYKKIGTTETVTIPASVFGLNAGTHSWELVEWSTDNRHVLLKHITTEGEKNSSEYILFDITKPEASQNLSKLFGESAGMIQLKDKKYDKYYDFSAANRTLSTRTLSQPAPDLVLKDVLQYKPYGSDKILYATTVGAADGMVSVRLLEGKDTYQIRQVPIGDKYFMDMASYSGDWYVLAGSSNDTKSYLYKDPQGYSRDNPQKPLVPVQILKIANPTFAQFSDNTRFLMVENGLNIAVYDAENDKGYNYTLQKAIDAPQQHVRWLHGHHFAYVSDGKLVVCDFDNTNYQTLQALDPTTYFSFDRDYNHVYSFARPTSSVENATMPLELQHTSLLTDKDL